MDGRVAVAPFTDRVLPQAGDIEIASPFLSHRISVLILLPKQVVLRCFFPLIAPVVIRIGT